MSYPTTSIKNCWWWLRQLLFLGVVWQDYQSLPTRTLHPQLTSPWQKKPLPSLQWTHDYPLSTLVLKHSCPFNFVGSPLSVHSSWLFAYPHARTFACHFVHPHAQDFFLVFTHAIFLCGFTDGVAVSFPYGLICGSCIVVSLTYKLGEL